MYKIMIIEDDNALCTNMNEMLIKWGFDTALVDNFENITAEFARKNPDLVIMDVNLPYFDGFLLLFISLIFAFIDYRRWKYSYKVICDAINNEDNIDASLPSSSYYFEVQLMKDIVNLKNAEMEGKVQEVKSALEEMNDYITKWVRQLLPT